MKQSLLLHVFTLYCMWTSQLFNFLSWSWKKWINLNLIFENFKFQINATSISNQLLMQVYHSVFQGTCWTRKGKSPSKALSTWLYLWCKSSSRCLGLNQGICMILINTCIYKYIFLCTFGIIYIHILRPKHLWHRFKMILFVHFYLK